MFPREFKNSHIQNWVQIYQPMQSGVGKLSCNKTALKRCTSNYYYCYYFKPTSTKPQAGKLGQTYKIMVATAIYFATMVLWKETAFPLCRAMERSWKRNVVSWVSSLMVVIRLPNYYYYAVFNTPCVGHKDARDSRVTLLRSELVLGVKI